MGDGFRSRKFILALIAMVVSAAALLTKTMDGNAWFLSIGVILGLYGTANVVEKRQQ